MGFTNRKTWSRKWRKPRRTLVSDCNFPGAVAATTDYVQPVPRKDNNPAEEHLYWQLSQLHGWVADVMYYAKWYSENIGAQRRARIEAFAQRCYHQMRYRATEGGQIPSENGLYWDMDYLRRKQDELIRAYRGLDVE